MLHKLDVVIIIILILLSCFTFMLLPNNNGDIVKITEHGILIYTGSIYKDALVKTRSGKNTIIISDGSVYMKDADCPDKLCVGMGKAAPGRPIVCLPNEVIVEITGFEQDIDDITY